MIVTVKLFAVHRQLLGRREAQVETPEGATIGDVWRALKAQHAQLSHLSDTVLAARNQDYAPLETHVQPGDEIAFIPPVSGGADRIRRCTGRILRSRLRGTDGRLKMLAPVVVRFCWCREVRRAADVCGR